MKNKKQQNKTYVFSDLFNKYLSFLNSDKFLSKIHIKTFKYPSNIVVHLSIDNLTNNYINTLFVFLIKLDFILIDDKVNTRIKKFSKKKIYSILNMLSTNSSSWFVPAILSKN